MRAQKKLVIYYFAFAILQQVSIVFCSFYQVVAQFPKEKSHSWYRASFQGWASATKLKLKVRYIDFGDSTDVDVSKVGSALRPCANIYAGFSLLLSIYLKHSVLQPFQVRLLIPEQTMKTPQVSLQIRLFAVAPVGDFWGPQQLNFLYDTLVGKTVFVSVPNCYQKVREDYLIANVYLSSE